jgi:phosphoglycolate phosphatase
LPALDCDTVLFDLDGTLIDSRYAITSCLNHALVANGLPGRDLRRLERFIGPPLHEVFLDLGADEAQAYACVESYRGRYQTTSLTETLVFDGIPEMQEAIARPMAVVTSKPRAYAAPLVDALGLAGYFDAVFGPSLEARAESKVTTLGAALEALPDGSRPVMVGDRVHDLEAARAHGIPSVGVLWGIGPAAELAAADVLVGEPAELVALLEKPGCPARASRSA